MENRLYQETMWRTSYIRRLRTSYQETIYKRTVHISQGHVESRLYQETM